MQRYKSPRRAQEYAESLGKQVLEQDPKARHSSPYQVTIAINCKSPLNCMCVATIKHAIVTQLCTNDRKMIIIRMANQAVELHFGETW